MADPVEVHFVLLSDQESESNRLHRQDMRVLIHFLALLACPNLLPSPFSWPVRLKEVHLMFLKASQEKAGFVVIELPRALSAHEDQSIWLNLRRIPPES
ncbi:hypothetical protein SESBI_17337 [Sesbania bispinosa]|nr:hypothetical protein SESBI_17337 [Sesbania bispinosa]